jgi:hypothetical protein
MKRSSGRTLVLLVGGVAALAAAGFLALPSGATVADTTCSADVIATFTDVSRPIVPIGVSVVRGFTVDATGGGVSAVHLSGPDGYNATQITAIRAYGLRLTAPHAGAFAVQATWSQAYTDDTGAVGTCSGAGSATLTASQGTPLVVRPPAVTRQHPFPHATAFVYADPAIWTWTCNANSDSTPLKATVRWELDPRQMPLGLKGFGHAPFTLSKHAKAFTVTAGDSCDSRQGGGVQKRLPQGSSLELLLVGDVNSRRGAMLLKLGKGFRLPNKNAEAIHVGVTLTQGSRTLVNSLLCTFAAYQWQVGKGYGVDCWQNP